MFTYWNGFEVDGSSTTYNVVLPEKSLIIEVIRYFLSLDIINRKALIMLSYSLSSNKNSEQKKDVYKVSELEKICEFIENSSLVSFSLNTSCIHPDKLYHKVRKELYELSKTRPGVEEIDLDYKNPTVSSLHYGPQLSVSISYNFSNYYNNPKETNEYKPDGLIFNEQSLINNLQGEHYNLYFECGPSFIYEYAAYIVSKIANRFPEIGIDGGIDCAGGFIKGCTYSYNLYDYEKIIIESPNIANSITKIINVMNIELQKRSGKYGYDISKTENLYLFNIFNLYIDDDLSKDIKIIKGILSRSNELTPNEYEKFVRKINEIINDDINFMHYCTCCFKINNEVCSLTCERDRDNIYLVFRIRPNMRLEFERKLHLEGIAIK